jgi:hypothetical protein
MTIVILYVRDAQTMEATTLIHLQPSVFALYGHLPTYARVAFRGNFGKSNFTFSRNFHEFDALESKYFKRKLIYFFSWFYLFAANKRKFNECDCSKLIIC